MGIIYMYTSPNGKKYVGQTRTSIMKRRKDAFGTGYVGSPHFYHAICKYDGLQNFDFEVLENVEDDELLDEKEKYYIELHDTLAPNGYNLNSGGQGQHNSRPVDQYNDKKEKIATYNSLAEAARKNQCSVECILHVLSGRAATGKGYYWAYKDEEPLFKKSSHRKRVYQFDLQGNLVKEFESARASDRYNKLSMGSSADCANRNRKRKRVGQYIFTYEPILDREYYNLPESND